MAEVFHDEPEWDEDEARYEGADGFSEPEEDDDVEGCCFPDVCCMPGFHFMSQCHTAEMYEQAMEEAKRDEERRDAANSD